MPKKLESCVEQVKAQGKSEESAYAICNASIDRKMFLDAKSTNILNKYIDERTGNLHIKARVSRDGIQEYLGMELGVDGLEPYKMYNVFRPTDEVTKDASLKTLVNAPVTDNHPDDFVNPNNSDILSKGIGLDYLVTKDGKDTVIEANLIIIDKQLIQKIKDGKVEISLGYEQELVKEDGIYDGVPYQFKQTDIKINHIAIVDAGRCGSKCKIVTDTNVTINHKNSNERVSMPSITIDNVQHEVTDCVAKYIGGLNSKLSDMETKIKSKDEDMEKLQAKTDATEEEMKAMKESMDSMSKKTSDSAINDAIAAKLKLIDTAKKVGCDCKVTDSNDSITDSIIAKKYPNINLDGKSEAYKNALIDAVEVSIGEEEEKMNEAEKSQMDATKDFKAKDGVVSSDADVSKRIADKKASAFQMPTRK